jgi:signal transduction histidine kinase
MLINLQLSVVSNALIALAYYTISALIFTGLFKQRRLGFNPLGTAVAFIFFTCGSGHALHAIHYLASWQMFSFMFYHDPTMWQTTLVDSLTVIPAASFLAQRRKYGLVIRGPHALLDFQRRLEVSELLRDIGQDIAARTDLADLLDRIVVHARALLDADYAVVVTQQGTDAPSTACAGTRGTHWQDPDVAAALFAPCTPSRAALEAGRPLSIPDLAADAACVGDAFRLHQEEGARALLAVPISRGAVRVGSLVIGFRTHQQVTPDGLSAAMVLSSQAAVAIENARLIDSLRRAERAKDEFLSVAAHELKTPVTSIRGFAQILSHKLAAGEQVDAARWQKSLATIDGQSLKLTRLVGQLLDVSRVETGQLALQPVPTDLAALIAEVAAATRLSRPQHTVIVNAPEAMMAFADPVRLEQVITNLVDNAAKYSPAGGKIAIDLQMTPDGLARIAVRDWGVGIAPTSRDRIFDRFYQAREADRTAGLGLGLYISREIVQMHGGTIVASFPSDGGTCMVITLPGVIEMAAEEGRLKGAEVA